MRTLKRLKTLGLVAAACTLFLPAVSRADTVTGVQTSDHCSGTGACGASLLNTITISDTGAPGATNTVFTFTVSLASGWTIVNTGFDVSIGFSSSLSDLVLSQPTGFTAIKQGATGMDGTGTFPATFYGELWNTQGGGHGDTNLPLTFTVTTSSAITLQTFINDLEASSGGAFVALDVFSGLTGNTGLIDFSGSLVPGQQSFVPLPGAAWLFGSALVGMGLLGRRRRKGQLTQA